MNCPVLIAVRYMHHQWIYQKHVKRGYPEAGYSDEEISVKRRKDDQDIDQGSDHESDESDVDEEETAFSDLAQRAIQIE